jgi:putative transposase
LKGLEPQSRSRLWLQRFDTVEDLRQAVLAFKERCNQGWIIERHGYKTPAPVRAEQLPPAALAA